MTRTAAFFDLDRTILPGGSGPVFAATLERLGVKTPRIPGQQWMFKLFDAVGESFVVMQLARQASRRTKGLDRAMVQASAEVAADTLLERVKPYAPALFAEHRLAGDLLVLATTSPFDLVAPFARRLGFDAVVATRYAELDGVYTGDVDGEFCWGPGKLRAVRDWASANDVDLEASAAYSDSVFDVPLLSAVGRPVVVNPDYRLRGVAVVRRWPVRNLEVPVGVPAVNGVEPLDIIRTLTRSEFFPGVRFRFEGVEHIPKTGPAIIAANHRSYFDPAALAMGLGKAGRNGRFMGKKEIFDAPVVGQIVRAMGAIRVDRGTASDEPLSQAVAALEGGETVVILPQGTIPRGESFFEPVLVGKTGTARLARLAPSVPLIPVGVWGTEKVWARSSKVPNLLQVGNPPEVVVRFGPPVALSLANNEQSVRSDTMLVMRAIMDLLPPESRLAREVSAAELARTMPGGKPSKPSKARSAKEGGEDAPVKEAAPTKAAAAKAAPGKALVNKAAVSTKASVKQPVSGKVVPGKASVKNVAAKKVEVKKAVVATPGLKAAPAKGTPPTRRVPGALSTR